MPIMPPLTTARRKEKVSSRDDLQAKLNLDRYRTSPELKKHSNGWPKSLKEQTKPDAKLASKPTRGKEIQAT